MAMMGKIDKGILGAFLMLLGLVALIGGLYLNQYIFGIILGSVFQTVQGGNLNVTTATTNFLNTTEASFFSTVGQVNTGATFAGGLITVAVVLLVFGGFIVLGTALYKKARGKGKGGDMGY